MGSNLIPNEPGSDSSSIEKTVTRTVQRIAIFLLSTGLLGNAVYIFGLSYYEGYVIGMGFEYNFFPIDWDSALLWSYNGSRWFGAETFLALTELSKKVVIAAVLLFLVTVTLVVRFFMYLNKQSNKTQKAIRSKKEGIYSHFPKLRRLKKNRPIFFKLTYRYLLRFIRFLFGKESMLAFSVSYFFLVVGYLFILFLLLWIFWPIFGANYGRVVAEKVRNDFEKNLCVNTKDYWSLCVVLEDENIKTNDQKLIGRLLFKNNNLLGVYTEKGPVTLTMPKPYYYANSQNPCYEDKDCLEKPEEE